MKKDHADRNFPAIRLADGPQAENPAAAQKRMLSELAERLDQYNERLAKLFLNQARSAPDCPLTACF